MKRIIKISLLTLFSFSCLANLQQLELAVQQDLEHINYPLYSWLMSEEDILDVAIIGGGMAGLTTAFALLRCGITNICIFDENNTHKEGPWVNARMRTLRSEKQFMGPALFLPNITFHAWYESKYGTKAWQKIIKAPTHVWMEYLVWYKEVLNLPIKNNFKLEQITPRDNYLELSFTPPSESKIVRTRKVVLATGRAGFGGYHMPAWANTLNPDRYAHTAQTISIDKVFHKKVVIIGCGSSAFDAAAFALENDADTVTMLCRRNILPAINKFASFDYPGLNYGFYGLSDEYKTLFFAHAYSEGHTPTKDSLDRIKDYKNFSLLLQRSIISVSDKGVFIECQTNQEMLACDFIILATGFAIDGTRQKELKSIIDSIALWKDKISLQESEKRLGEFPYLGAHFEFLEKIPGTALYLKNIHCFNYAASLSHGLLSADIPAISVGALRLAEGITKDLFAKNVDFYLRFLYNVDLKEFDISNYSFAKH